MALQPLHRLTAVRADPAARLYGSLFLLLLASNLFEFTLIRGVDAVSGLVPDALDPRLVGSVVSAVLGLVLLAVVYGAVRHLHGSEESLEPHDLVQLGGVAGMLLLVFGYVLHDVADVPVFPGVTVTSLLTGVVAMGSLAFVYARLRGLELRLEIPDRDALPVAGTTVALCAITGLAQVVVFAVTQAPRFDASVGVQFGPRLSMGLLVWSVVVPGVFVGFGNGLLYNGAVQEGLREHLGPSSAVAAMTATVGVIGWAFVGVGLIAGPAGSVASITAVVLLSLLAAVVAVLGSRHFARVFDVELTPALAAALGALVVSLPLVVMALIQQPTAAIAVSGIAVAVVAGVAGVGYERERSVWVPVLGFASYHVVADVELALALLRALG